MIETPNGDLASKLRAAIDAAVMQVPGAMPLGEADFARIYSRVSDSAMSMQDRIRLAQSYAAEIAVANRDQPRNIFDQRPGAPHDSTPGQFLWAGSGSFGAGGVGRHARDRDGGGEPGGGAYARGMPADPAFLRSVGVSPATGSALAALGFNTPEQIRQLVGDANSLKIDRNKGAVSLGTLKRYDPKNYHDHMNFFRGTYAPGLDGIKKIDGQIAREKDPAKKAALQKKRAEEMRALEAKRQKQRAKIKNPRARKAFDDTGTLMRNSRGVRAQLGHDAKDAPRNVSNEHSVSSLSSNDVRATERTTQEQKQVFANVSDDEWRKAATSSRWEDDDKPPADAPAHRPPTQQVSLTSPGETPPPVERNAAGAAKPEQAENQKPSAQTSSEADKKPDDTNRKPEPKSQTASNDGVKDKAPNKEPEKKQVQARSTKASAPTVA